MREESFRSVLAILQRDSTYCVHCLYNYGNQKKKSMCCKNIAAVYEESKIISINMFSDNYNFLIFEYDFAGKHYKQQTLDTVSKRKLKAYKPQCIYMVHMDRKQPERICINNQVTPG